MTNSAQSAAPRTDTSCPSRGRWKMVALVSVGILVLTWLGYKGVNTRFGTAISDSRCAADPAAVVNLGQITPAAGPVPCEPWDIGTGVTGYSWHAPNARAVVLIQRGFSEYVFRYIRQHNHLIPQLLSHGISVYAFDAWGHGHSPGARAATDVNEAANGNLAARRLLKNQPLPVFLFGHSMGGLITATSVLRDQSGIKGVILTGPVLYTVSSPALVAAGQVVAFLAPIAPSPFGGTPKVRPHHSEG